MKEKVLEWMLDYSLRKLSENSFYVEFSKKVYVDIFNLNYKDINIKKETPYEEVDMYHDMLKKNDLSFVSRALFRELRRSNDREYRKLMYKMRRKI